MHAIAESCRARKYLADRHPITSSVVECLTS